MTTATKSIAGERTQRWPILEANGTLLAIRDPKGISCTNDIFIAGHGGSSMKQSEKLVRLFAAAPELLQALKDAVEQLRTYGADNEDVGDFLYAINKAEGK